MQVQHYARHFLWLRSGCITYLFSILTAHKKIGTLTGRRLLAAGRKNLETEPLLNGPHNPLRSHQDRCDGDHAQDQETDARVL